MKHVTIIGGGITGLATAFYLQKNKNMAVTLLEASSRLGGKIITEHVDGFTIEGGPDSFITEKPWATQLCQELGLADQLIPLNEFDQGVYALRHGKLVPFPKGFRLAIPTQIKPFLFSRIVSPWCKLRMGLDYFIPARLSTNDESLAAFFRRRLGQEALDRIAGPIMAGIFVADPEKLSMQATFPRFIDLEKQYGSLIRAMRSAKKQPRTGPIFYSLKNGMNAMVDQLVARLSCDIQLGCATRKILKKGDRFEIVTDRSTFETDLVVVTSPAHEAADMLHPTHATLAGKLKAIRYLNASTVSLVYRASAIPKDCPMRGYGVVLPAVENRKISALTWLSRKFDHRAPKDHHMFRIFIGGYRHENLAELPDDQLVQIARAELKDILGINQAPVLHRVFRWMKGNPQYDVGHLDRIAEIETLASEIPGLHLAGSAYRGIGMPDCIKSGMVTAEKILTAN